MTLKSRDLIHRITFLQKVPLAGVMGGGSASWDPAGTVWAQIVDVLPSRGDKLAAGVEITARPARIRIRHTEFELQADMRIQFGARLMQIISAPAELIDRDGVELMVEDYTTTGSPA